jgi:VanZ family protein
VLLEKSFWYTCVVWLGARAGLGLVRATFACAMLLGAIEVAQVFIPGRTPETTDPVLALLLGGLLRVLDEPAPPRVLA